MLALSLLQVSQDLPFLHPSESSVLNRICKLGTDYIRFKEFIEQHTEHVHQQVSRSLVTPSASPCTLSFPLDASLGSVVIMEWNVKENIQVLQELWYRCVNV